MVGESLKEKYDGISPLPSRESFGYSSLLPEALIPNGEFLRRVASGIDISYQPIGFGTDADRRPLDLKTFGEVARMIHSAMHSGRDVIEAELISDSVVSGED